MKTLSLISARSDGTDDGNGEDGLGAPLRARTFLIKSYVPTPITNGR